MGFGNIGVGDSGNDLVNGIPAKGSPEGDWLEYQATRKENAFDYNQSNTGSAAAQARYQQMGADAANRGTYQINYNAANQDAENAAAARMHQQDALMLQKQAAMGQAPSVAQIQMQQGLDSAARSQQSLANSARGPAALALAQQQAGYNTAAIQQQGVNQSAALRAQEMADARNSYMGGATGMRGQDYTAQGQSAQEAQAQAQIEMQQRGLNQQAQMGYEGMGKQVADQELNAQMQRRALEEGHWAGQAGLDQHSNDRDTNTGMGLVAAGGTALTLASDPRSKLQMVPIGRNEPMGKQAPWLPPNAFPDYSLLSDPSSKDSVMSESHAGMDYAGRQFDALRRLGESGFSAPDMRIRAPAKKEEASTPATPAAPKTGGGIIRENPYGSDGGLTSDPRAKREAKMEGMVAGAEAIKRQMAMAYGAPSPVQGALDRSAPMGPPRTAEDEAQDYRGGIIRRNPYGEDQVAIRGRAPVGATEPERMANSMEPISYEYKGEPGRRRYGITTEQLKQTPMGASLVEKGPGGYEQVNVPQAAGASMAMHADQQDQLNELKAQIAAMRGAPMAVQPALDRDADRYGGW